MMNNEIDTTQDELANAERFKAQSRAEQIEEIISIFVKLGICEPRTEEERREVEERRQRIGAENFDRTARETYCSVMAFIDSCIADNRKEGGRV